MCVGNFFVCVGLLIMIGYFGRFLGLFVWIKLFGCIVDVFICCCDSCGIVGYWVLDEFLFRGSELVCCCLCGVRMVVYDGFVVWRVWCVRFGFGVFWWGVDCFELRV